MHVPGAVAADNHEVGEVARRQQSVDVSVYSVARVTDTYSFRPLRRGLYGSTTGTVVVVGLSGVVGAMAIAFGKPVALEVALILRG